MVNLRSKSKATVQGTNLSEAALRNLPRAELQKVAKAHKVKANTKSELIIRQLSSLQIPKKTRPVNDDPEEGSSQKRFRIKGPQLPEVGPSAPQSTPPVQQAPTVVSYDKDLFSGTESEMTEEEQLDFATPISTRSETPPPANVNDLTRCVKIMREISAQDVAILDEVTGVRETAAKLRKRARDVRGLVKAENGRRERMEAYFRYWQEIEPTWDREWFCGENDVADHQ